MSYEADLVRSYAGARARLWPVPTLARANRHVAPGTSDSTPPSVPQISKPISPLVSIRQWSPPFVVEIFPSDEGKIAAIVAGLSPDPSVRDVIVLTARQYGMSVAVLLRPDQRPIVARPRMIAMAIAKAFTGKSYPHIGRCFGGRHHTTALHAVQKYSALVERAMARGG